jgi:hypothetical protein
MGRHARVSTDRHRVEIFEPMRADKFNREQQLAAPTDPNGHWLSPSMNRRIRSNIAFTSERESFFSRGGCCWRSAWSWRAAISSRLSPSSSAK